MSRLVEAKLNSKLAIFITGLFFISIGVSVAVTDLSVVIPAFYLFASVTTLIVYAIDKSAAKKGRWRTSEATLHFLALAGGWPGALVGQQVFRHKRKKASFLIVFGFTVLINCTALVLLHTPLGRTTLDRLLDTMRYIITNYSIGMPSLS